VGFIAKRDRDQLRLIPSGIHLCLTITRHHDTSYWGFSCSFTRSHPDNPGGSTQIESALRRTGESPSPSDSGQYRCISREGMPLISTGDIVASARIHARSAQLSPVPDRGRDDTGRHASIARCLPRNEAGSVEESSKRWSAGRVDRVPASTPWGWDLRQRSQAEASACKTSNTGRHCAQGASAACRYP
jgi:hypothetical protein